MEEKKGKLSTCYTFLIQKRYKCKLNAKKKKKKKMKNFMEKVLNDQTCRKWFTKFCAEYFLNIALWSDTANKIDSNEDIT